MEMHLNQPSDLSISAKMKLLNVKVIKKLNYIISLTKVEN